MARTAAAGRLHSREVRLPFLISCTPAMGPIASGFRLGEVERVRLFRHQPVMAKHCRRHRGVSPGTQGSTVRASGMALPNCPEWTLTSSHLDVHERRDDAA